MNNETFLLGAISLAAVHALIPNHWIPLILISKRDKWTKFETFYNSGIVGLAHVLSSILIGIVIGWLGINLFEFSETVFKWIAATILLYLGYKSLKSGGHHHHHGDHHHHEHEEKEKKTNLLGLALAMFLSPCIELESYYLYAAKLGWLGIFQVSIIYLLITVPLIVILVFLGLKIQEKLSKKLHWLEHHEGKVNGLIFVLVALSLFFLD